MQISKIKISNFRSIVAVEVEPSQFNVFVGQNNHGKTNLFEAMNWFYSAKGDDKEISHRQQGGEIRVEVTFSGVQAGVEAMKNEKKKATIRAAIGDRDVIRIVRSSTEKKRKIYNEEAGQWEDPGTGFDPALNDLLPNFEYVHTKLHLEDVMKYGKTTPIGQMLSGVLSAILETNPHYMDFKQKFEELFGDDSSEVKVKLDELSGQVKGYLSKQFPDCTKVDFEVSHPAFEDLLKNFDTSVDDGVYTDAMEKGDGMQRALMLAIIQAFADFRRENDDQGKSFLFFIDEGELHLHPTAQRQLKDALLEISNGGDQIFLNTHSSVLVADDHDSQTIFKVVKTHGNTDVIPIATESDKQNVIYDLLGGSPNDLLLPRNFLIVEGLTEREFLSAVINRFYADKPKMQIVPAGGDHVELESTMHHINKVFMPLKGNPIYKDRLIVLTDQPHASVQSNFDDFKTSNPELEASDRLKILPHSCIEQYYPSAWRMTESERRAMSGEQKVALGRKVGAEISQEEFESNMSFIYEALQRCWDLSYN